MFDKSSSTQAWKTLLLCFLCLAVPILMAAASTLSSLKLYPEFGETYALEVQDSSASDTLTVDAAGDVKLLETGGSSGDADLEVDGYAQFDGTVKLNSNVSYAVTKSLWFSSEDFKLPTSNPATAAEEDSLGTLSFADSSADDNAWLAFLPPDDCDVSSPMSIYVYYVLPSGTPSEGEWNFLADGFIDDDALSAAATQLTTVHDTPAAAGDLNITTASSIPTAVMTDGLINLNIYHDVDDQFGGAVELIGLRIDYTSDKP